MRGKWAYRLLENVEEPACHSGVPRVLKLQRPGGWRVQHEAARELQSESDEQRTQHESPRLVRLLPPLSSPRGVMQGGQMEYPQASAHVTTSNNVLEVVDNSSCIVMLLVTYR